jgi:HAD superfamily hydrolase (TIGR01509 family)
MLEILARERIPPIDVAQLWAQYPRKKAMFRERMAATLPFVSGARELLSCLHQDFKLAVVTSTGRSEVAPLLESANLTGFLDTVIYGDDVTTPKPAPEPYLLAAQRLHVTRALVVEDSKAGMESARAAGFEALQVPNPSRTVELVRSRLSL